MKLRVMLLEEYRSGHADRVRQDRNGQTAIERSLQMRIGWASGTWMDQIRNMALKYSNRQGLLDSGVLSAVDETGAVLEIDDPARAPADYQVDDFMLTTFETMARTFFRPT